jgi:hypothetical protein
MIMVVGTEKFLISTEIGMVEHVDTPALGIVGAPHKFGCHCAV